MTDCQAEIEALRRRVDDLQSELKRTREVLNKLLSERGKSARSSARRLRNILDRQERFAALCDDLAASVA